MTTPYPEIKKAGLIGYGKLAKHLAPALVSCGIEINQWCVRNKNDHAEIAAGYGVVPVSDIKQLDDSSDLILLLVNDQAIGQVAMELNKMQSIVCHTSGMTSVDILPQENAGVFYPLNTFNGMQTQWDSDTPLFVHSKNDKTLDRLLRLAACLSNSVQAMAHSDLQFVHLAAVMSQNFSNHLIAHGEQILEANQLDRSLIHPLLKTMIKNLKYSPASKNQTGPAIRGDHATIAKQIQLLNEDENKLNLYRTLTKSLQSTNPTLPKVKNSL